MFSFLVSRFSFLVSRFSFLVLLQAIAENVDGDVLTKQVLPMVIKLAKDPVPNVRFNCARTLGTLSKFVKRCVFACAHDHNGVDTLLFCCLCSASPACSLICFLLLLLLPLLLPFFFSGNVKSTLEKLKDDDDDDVKLFALEALSSN